MGKAQKKSVKSKGGEILYYQAENGDLRIETRLQDGTVWLTQPLMAELYQTTQQNISQHIQNIYEEGELTPEATHKKFLLVRSKVSAGSAQSGILQSGHYHFSGLSG